MPSVSDHIVDRATVHIGEGDDPLEITYRPGRLTGDRAERLVKSINTDNDVLAIAYLLAGTGKDDGVMISWNLTGPLEGERDVLDAEGKPVLDDRGHPVTELYVAVPEGEAIPIAAEYMRFLRPDYVAGMYIAIREHAQGFSQAFFGNLTATSKNGSSGRS